MTDNLRQSLRDLYFLIISKVSICEVYISDLGGIYFLVVTGVSTILSFVKYTFVI